MSSLLPFLLMSWVVDHFTFLTLIGKSFHKFKKIVGWMPLATFFGLSASDKECVSVYACYLPNVIERGNWLSHICHSSISWLRYFWLLKVFSSAVTHHTALRDLTPLLELKKPTFWYGGCPWILTWCQFSND